MVSVLLWPLRVRWTLGAGTDTSVLTDLKKRQKTSQLFPKESKVYPLKSSADLSLCTRAG